MPTPVKLSCGRARYITSGVAASPKRSKRALHRYITSAFAPAAAQTLPILQPILSGSPTGLVVALAVLAAVRLERARSERHLQDLKQDDLREAWTNLFDLQQLEYRQKEALKLAAAKRLQEAEREATVQERLRQQEQRILQDALNQQQAAAQAKQDEERASFEAREHAMRAEMQQRTEAAQKLRAAEAEQRRLEQKRLHREAEAQRRQREAFERQRLLDQRAQEEEQRQHVMAAKRALDRLKTRFALRIYGEATIGLLAASTAGGQSSALELTVSMTSSAGGAASVQKATFLSSTDLSNDALFKMAAPAAAAMTQQHESNMQLQQMSGQGPLMVMQEPELRHWARLTQLRMLAATTSCVRGLVKPPTPERGTRTEKFEVRSERAVLPAGYEERVDTQLRQAAALMSSENYQDAQSLLLSVMSGEEDVMNQGITALVPKHAGQILALVFFMEQEAPTSQDSSTERQALSVLRHALSNATKDSIMPAAEALGAILPPTHPIMGELHRLAEANMSESARRQRLELQRLQEARHAAAILEEEYPDSAERKKATAAAREAATPVPERVWALRNVGSTLAMGGADEQARARQMLERAVVLKQQWLNNPRHPGVLPDLEALRQLMERNTDWQADGLGVCSLQLNLLSVIAERYITQGEVASAVILQEAAVRAYEQHLSVSHPLVKAMSQRAEQLLSALTPEQRQQVSAARGRSTLQKAFAAFEEEVAARQLAAAPSKRDIWNAGGLQPLPSLT